MIINYDETIVRYDSLEPGDIFSYSRMIFIKTNKPHNSDKDFTYCVNLENGSLEYLCGSILVAAKKGEVIIQ